MRFFSSDPHVPGFIAVGQVATGVFVLAQFGTGVFVIGQFARGVVAIGQFAFGLFAVGQFAVGAVRVVALMGGLGARAHLIALSLWPRWQSPWLTHPLPPETTLEALRARGEGEGFVRVRYARGEGALVVRHAGARLDAMPDVELDPAIIAELGRELDAGRPEALVKIFVETRRDEDVHGFREAPRAHTILSGQAVQRIRSAERRSPFLAPKPDKDGKQVEWSVRNGAMRLTLLAVVVMTWAALVGAPIVEALF